MKWDDVAGLEGAKDSLKEVCRNVLFGDRDRRATGVVGNTQFVGA